MSTLIYTHQSFYACLGLWGRHLKYSIDNVCVQVWGQVRQSDSWERGWGAGARGWKESGEQEPVEVKEESGVTYPNPYGTRQAEDEIGDDKTLNTQVAVGDLEAKTEAHHSLGLGDQEPGDKDITSPAYLVDDDCNEDREHVTAVFLYRYSHDDIKVTMVGNFLMLKWYLQPYRQPLKDTMEGEGEEQHDTPEGGVVQHPVLCVRVVRVAVRGVLGLKGSR